MVRFRLTQKRKLFRCFREHFMLKTPLDQLAAFFQIVHEYLRGLPLVEMPIGICNDFHLILREKAGPRRGRDLTLSICKTKGTVKDRTVLQHCIPK